MTRPLLPTYGPPAHTPQPLPCRRFSAFLLIVCVLIAFIPLPGWSQSDLIRIPTVTAAPGDYTITTWGVDDGLPQSSVSCMLQTSEGYLWIGTWNGLARFDGHRFTSFHIGNTPELAAAKINGLAEDAQGDLWIATGLGGLTRYHRGSFYAVGTSLGLPRTDINKIAFGPDQRLWLATSNGLFLVADDSLYDLGATHPRFSGAIDNIDVDSSGMIWINLIDSLVWARDFDGMLNVVGAMASRSGRFALDTRNRVWVQRRDGGLQVFDGATGAELQRVWVSNRFASMSPLRDGRIGLCELDRVILTDDQTGTILKQVGDISIRVPEVIYADWEGNYWLGRASSGLARIRKSTVRSLGEADGLSSSVITGIVQDASGDVWVGTFKGGLNRFSNGRFRMFTADMFDTDGWTNTLWPMRDGSVWAAPWASGILILRPGRPPIPFQEGLVGRYTNVSVIREDDAGGVWVGTHYVGAQYTRHGRTTIWDTSTGLSSNEIRAILPTQSGRTFIGTITAGLDIISGGEVQSFSTEHGLTSNEILTLLETPGGSVWIATRRGLNRWRDGRLSRVTVGQGLIDDAIAQMVLEDSSYVWFGSIKGIFRVPLADLEAAADGTIETIRSESFGTEDGMVSLEVGGSGSPSVWSMRDGTIWFASERGIVVVDPRTIQPNTVPPNVIIEGVSIEHEPVPFDSVIILDPDHTSLEISYTGISFNSPTRVRFQTWLEGFEHGYGNVSDRRFVQYTHLPAGDYEFHVRAANSDGVWSETAATVSIIVLPPFWQEPWFIGAVVVFFLFAGPSAYAIRVRALRAEQRRQRQFSQRLIESQEEERRRIAGGLHDGVGQNLLVIKSRLRRKFQAEVAGEKERSSDDVTDLLSRTIDEIRAISHDLHPNQLYDIGLARSIEGLAGDISASCGIEIRTDLDITDKLLPKEHELNCFRIVQESLNNIIKHSRATSVEISVRHHERSLTLRIADNGVGIDSPSEKTYGFGMRSMAERAKLAGGTFQVSGEPGRGVTIEVSVPLSA